MTTPRRRTGGFRSQDVAQNRTAASAQKAVNGLGRDTESMSRDLASISNLMGPRVNTNNAPPEHWDTAAPTTVWEAIERIAARLYVVSPTKF